MFYSDKSKEAAGSAHGHQDEFEDTSEEEEFSEEEEEDSDEEITQDDDDDDDEEAIWVEWFCSQKGHEYYVEVDEEFIRDDFNLTGLSSYIPHYSRALNLILDEEEDLTEEAEKQLAKESALLYGLIHARFLLTNRGLELIYEKYTKSVYGNCLNTLCNSQSLLPIGLVDMPCREYAKVFCPRCNEVYHPPKTSRLGLLDGACFGTTFPHLFVLQLLSKVPPHPVEYYIPKVHGFKIHTNLKDMLRGINGGSNSKESGLLNNVNKGIKNDISHNTSSSRSVRPTSTFFTNAGNIMERIDNNNNNNNNNKE